MTRADHLAAVASQVEAARSQIAAEERAEKLAEARAAREARRAKALREAAALELETATPPRPCGGSVAKPRGGPCTAPGCEETVPAGSRFVRYCSNACAVRAWRERRDPKVTVRLVCECGCGKRFSTRRRDRKFATDRCRLRAAERRAYWRKPWRREPRGVNRTRALARAGGAA